MGVSKTLDSGPLLSGSQASTENLVEDMISKFQFVPVDPSDSQPTPHGSGPDMSLMMGGSATAKETTDTRPVFRCSHQSCLRSFKRKADLSRHTRIHSPSSSLLLCPIPGCDRGRVTGFYRKDKLQAHLRRMHGRKGGSIPRE